ncbi:flagellar basal-body rod protein FlgF [Marinicauda algicola]|uniref:Flagellar basal-body rod protein FlgF n=1 Tax=Marinicauda algicola TaxID=2029849 RepID=A0A4S2H338_9PROT|nr:flagellar basal-body rod protein FlgF [Marinicauda algicola]TGY90015.1 flagellar basal-body rod protein FlgF [Marinicauda algicola]
MDNAMMIGLARQQTLRQAMDISANNIANTSTTGFKAEQVLLETDAATRARHSDGPGRLAFVDEWGVGRDFSQGALQGTGRPLDLAIEGEGFFALETEAGERFTRDGRFTLSAEGEIVAADGARLLDEGGFPIRLAPEGGEIEVRANGEVMQDGVPVARLALTRFEAPGQLSKTGDNRYSAPEDAARETVLDPVVRQGFIEASNVRPVMELTRMMEISRTYASVTRMINQTDELGRKALERLGRP